METREVIVSASLTERAVTLFANYLRSPNDADIEFRAGASTEGVPAIAVSFGGVDYGLLSSEARALANVAEGILHHSPAKAHLAGLPNLILGLRAMANVAEQAAASQAPRP
jgi:hypothetical protein